MKTYLSKRWLRSRLIAVSTSRVPTIGQMTPVDTTVPQYITPEIEQVQSSPRSNYTENIECQKEIKNHKARITKSVRTNAKLNPHLNPSKLANTSWKHKRTNLKEIEIEINILTTHIHVQGRLQRPG